MRLARTREALHNNWAKNNPMATQVILLMPEYGSVQFFHDPPVTGNAETQGVSKPDKIVSGSKAELWHRILTHYLPMQLPDAERIHGRSRTDWLLAFPDWFPCPHMISVMSRKAVIEGAWRIVGHKVGKEQMVSDVYTMS